MTNHHCPNCGKEADEHYCQYTKSDWPHDIYTKPRTTEHDASVQQAADETARRAANKIREATGQEPIPAENHQTIGFRAPGMKLDNCRRSLEFTIDEMHTPRASSTNTTAAIESLIRHLTIDLLDSNEFAVKLEENGAVLQEYILNSEDFKSTVIAQATQLVSAAFPTFLETPMFKEAVIGVLASDGPEMHSVFNQSMGLVDAIEKHFEHSHFKGAIVNILDELGLITRNGPVPAPLPGEIIEIDQAGNVTPVSAAVHRKLDNLKSHIGQMYMGQTKISQSLHAKIESLSNSQSQISHATHEKLNNIISGLTKPSKTDIALLTDFTKMVEQLDKFCGVINAIAGKQDVIIGMLSSTDSPKNNQY